MEEKSQSIMDRIFELLNEKGISQKKLSDMTGISTSAISDWKHKGTNPSSSNVKKICEALNVNPEIIMCDSATLTAKGIFISENDDLYQFVCLYNKLDGNMQSRILAYAIAMMKCGV